MKPHSDRGVIGYNHYSTCYNLSMKRRRATRSVIQYVEQYGGCNFWRLPFNEVDSLILSTLCYADLAVSATLIVPYPSLTGWLRLNGWAD